MSRTGRPYLIWLTSFEIEAAAFILSTMQLDDENSNSGEDVVENRFNKAYQAFGQLMEKLSALQQYRKAAASSKTTEYKHLQMKKALEKVIHHYLVEKGTTKSEEATKSSLSGLLVKDLQQWYEEYFEEPPFRKKSPEEIQRFHDRMLGI